MSEMSFASPKSNLLLLNLNGLEPNLALTGEELHEVDRFSYL